MNLKQIIVTFTICAMALETGCVGVEPRSATPPLQPEAARTGVAPRFMTILHFDKAFAHSAKPDGAAKDLYVSDFDNAAINILRNRTYKFVGAIPWTTRTEILPILRATYTSLAHRETT